MEDTNQAENHTIVAQPMELVVDLTNQQEHQARGLSVHLPTEKTLQTKQQEEVLGLAKHLQNQEVVALGNK